MLATRCPSCGGVIPVSIASPDAISCGYCSYQGPPPPETTESLKSASEVLHQRDKHERQVGAARQNAIASAKRAELIFLVATVLVGLIIVGSSAVFVVNVALQGYSYENLNDINRAPLVAVWSMSVTVISAIAFAVVRRKRTKLEQACAANPPLQAGQPSTCHVCGAPLPATGTEATSRCSFCEADNIVSESVLRTAKKRRSIRLDRYEEAVASETAAMSGAVSSGALGWYIAVFASWFICGFPTACVSVLAQSAYEYHLERSPNETYTLVATDQGQCVERVTRTRYGVRLDSGGASRSAPGPVQPITLKSLRGKRVRIRAEGLVGDVRRTGFREEGGYVTVHFGKPHYRNRMLRPYELCILP